MTTDYRPETGNTCPVHQTRSCECSTTNMNPHNLTQPRVIALWECENGHREVAAPTIRNVGGCNRCGHTMTRIEWGMHPGWKVDDKGVARLLRG